MDIVAPKPGQIQGFRHHDKASMVAIDRTLDEVSADDYDALVLPGGALSADALRIEPAVQAVLEQVNDADKPIAAICHAPWELVSADLVWGRRLTSYFTIQDDIRNAKGTWTDQEVVVEGNWVTSRRLSDSPAFNREMLALFQCAR